MRGVPIGGLKNRAGLSLSEEARLGLKRIIQNVEDLLEEEINSLIQKYPGQERSSNKFEELSLYCHQIDEAIRRMQPPYNIDQIVKAIKILGLRVKVE